MMKLLVRCVCWPRLGNVKCQHKKSSAWMPLHNAASRPSRSSPPADSTHISPPCFTREPRFFRQHSLFCLPFLPSNYPATQLLSTFTFPRQIHYSTTSTPSSLLIRYLSFTQYTFTASRVASCRSARNISSS